MLSQHTFSDCFQKAGSFETHEVLNEDNWEVSPCIWAGVQDKAKVTFTFEEYIQASDNLLSCAVQEIGEVCCEVGLKEENDEHYEEGEAVVYRSFPTCSEAMQCLDR
jgi:hypothetical protein